MNLTLWKSQKEFASDSYFTVNLDKIYSIRIFPRDWSQEDIDGHPYYKGESWTKYETLDRCIQAYGDLYESLNEKWIMTIEKVEYVLEEGYVVKMKRDRKSVV